MLRGVVLTVKGRAMGKAEGSDEPSPTTKVQDARGLLWSPCGWEGRAGLGE